MLCFHTSSFGNLIYFKSFQLSPLFSITYPKVYWIPALGSLIVISNAMYPKLYSPAICKTSALDFLYLHRRSPSHPNSKPQSSLTSSSITHNSTDSPCSHHVLLWKNNQPLLLLHHNVSYLSSLYHLHICVTLFLQNHSVLIHLIEQYTVLESII